MNFYHMYPEIQEAIDQTGVEQMKLVETLRCPVMFNVNSSYKDSTVRSRLGSGWPSDLKQAALQNEDTNPFLGRGKNMNPEAIGRHCIGVIAKTPKQLSLGESVD